MKIKISPMVYEKIFFGIKEGLEFYISASKGNNPEVSSDKLPALEVVLSNFVYTNLASIIDFEEGQDIQVVSTDGPENPKENK